MRLFFFSLFALACGASAVDITATWNGTSGNWSDAARWSTTPIFPNNAPPNLYDAVVNAGTVTLNQNIAINQLVFGGGSINGTSRLSLAEGFAWSGGATLALTGAGRITLGAGSASSVSGTATFQSGTIIGGGGATISVPAGATFTALGQAAFFADTVSPAWTFTNAGTFVARSNSGVGFTTMDGTFNNSSVMRVEAAVGAAHTLSLAAGGTIGGSVQLDAGTTIEFGDNTTLANTTFTGAGVPVIGGRVVISGTVQAPSLREAVGELHVSASATLRAPGGVTVDDGLVTGFGTIDGAIDNQGNIAPGLSTGSTGTLTLTGNAILGTDAKLLIEIGGTSLTLFDRMLLGGSALLGGELELRLANGFNPSPAATFTILTATGGVTGVFENALLDGFRLNTSDGLGSFLVDYQPNAIVLTNYIPEPSSALLLLASAGAWLMKRRRTDSR